MDGLEQLQEEHISTGSCCKLIHCAELESPVEVGWLMVWCLKAAGSGG